MLKMNYLKIFYYYIAMELIHNKYNTYFKGVLIGIISIVSYYHAPKFYNFFKKSNSLQITPPSSSPPSPLPPPPPPHYTKKTIIYNSDDEYFNDNYPIGLPIEHMYYNSDNENIYA
jgi:hypothetical protein